MTDQAWVLLKSGQRLDLLEPHPHAWTNDDIATGLARTYRWGGHSQWNLPLSVAQHSLSVLAIREQLAGRTLTPHERLRELAHDLDEDLLGYDAIAPLKPHLGDGYQNLVKRLQRAIGDRYDLQPWDRTSHAAHKEADRLAAASEAHHVVGWKCHDIRQHLRITIEPLASDPVMTPAGMRPWEPWPPALAARLYLDQLRDLQLQTRGGAEPDYVCVVAPDQVMRTCAYRPWEEPTYVSVEGGDLSIEGYVVKGLRGEAGRWDLDSVFTVQDEDGGLTHVHGSNCVTKVLL